MITVGLGIWQQIQDIQESNLAKVHERNIIEQRKQQPRELVDEEQLAVEYSRYRFMFSLGYFGFCISLVILLKKWGYWYVELPQRELYEEQKDCRKPRP
jgi:hypothetical protein